MVAQHRVRGHGARTAPNITDSSATIYSTRSESVMPHAHACSRAFAPTHALVFAMPVLLLTLYGAVTCVPATVVHGFLLAVVALKTQTKR